MPNPAITRREPPVTPAGEGRSLWRTTLEAGAALLQDMTPLKDFDIYVVGLHCAKHEPRDADGGPPLLPPGQPGLPAVHALRRQHQGRQPDRHRVHHLRAAVRTLPEDERPYWHPHNYEILSGQLVAPGLPEVAERAFLQQLMNSYGKTWHTWHTGRHDGEPGDPLPLGDPKLMWSFNRDGEADERLKRDFQRQWASTRPAKRAQRRPLTELAHPQHGVDAMKDEFTDTRPLRGVADAHRT